MNGEINCSIMCRACMKVDGVLLPMYGDDMISKKNLPDKLAELASIQIDKYDGLPNVLCAKCAYRTDSFHDFKLQVQATERKLRKMFQCPDAVIASPKTESRSENVTIRNISVSKAYSETLKNSNDSKILSIKEDKERDDTAIFPLDDINIPRTFDLPNDGDTGDFGSLENLNVILTRESVETADLRHEFSNHIGEIFNSPDYALLYVNSEKSMINIATNGNVDRSADGAIMSEESEWIRGDDNDDDNNVNNDKVNDDDVDKSNFVNRERNRAGATFERVEKLSLARGNADKESGSVVDDSDSDYFIEPKNNLLGSLNDTITRIREIRVDVETVNFQCTLCKQNYESLSDVLVHTVDNHVPPKGPFFCIVCEKDCSSLRDLRNHTKSHSGRYPYSCFICNKSYSMKRYLKRHMSCHTDFPRHRCPKCGERFAVKSELDNHVREHATESKALFSCSQCPRMFNHKGNYKRHLIGHLDPKGLHLPKYPCEICGKRFLNNRTLRTHVRVHTGEKPYLCEICNKTFSQQGNLINHRRIHSNPRSYTCEVCGKRFNQAATLRDHGLLHTGEKPWVCNVCGVAFTFSAALRRHMWSHAADKPFGCEICNARFVGKYDIKRHMKIHSDRPRIRRKRNYSRNDQQPKTETDANDPSDQQTILIEQVLMADDDATGQTIVHQQDDSTEKENVDALLNLIQYG